MLKFNFSRPAMRFALLALVTVFALLFSTGAIAQTTVAQGSIQGTVTDPSGAVVSGAKITITNKATGQVVNTTSSSAGAYNSGGLIPGDYTVRVEAAGFKTSQLPVVVQVAVTSSGNVKLEIGQGSTVVEVQSSAVTVNTEQATVQGVLTADQIDRLPVDGRNFLDLAQLEPGVQIQDGQDFDPTKAGYSSISINGVFGRTPRIELDGLDISDETVGTTTQNIGLGSIQEFNISRSNLDLSTELTSAGSVNVTTRSGTNALHGNAFYNFRDRNAGTDPFPGDVIGYYQRNNYGGRLGGPIMKDKLFFFFDAERQKQDGEIPVVVPAPYSALTGGFLSPFRDVTLTGKIDWNATKDIHVFYRYSDNWNKSEANFGYDFQVYQNRDYSQSHAVGVDWNKGSWSNSFRFGYLKFHNLIGDATQGASFYDPLPQAEILFLDLNVQLSGPNLLAPQQTFQSNKQIKYDGSKVYKSHIFRFGAGYNDINGGGFASFFGIAPLLLAESSINAGNATDPTNALLLAAILGNGQGFFTEKPNFGFPAGGQGDHRFQAYAGDSWKVKPNFTFTYGLRYNRDTGRSDADLAPIPCSATTLITCSGNLLDQWGAGLGKRINQPNTQFGPQVGFAWDPKSNGKTAIRGGFGIYYENSIFNNTLFDRPAKLPVGLFFQDSVLSCANDVFGDTSFFIPGTGNVTSVNGQDLGTQVCYQPLSTAAPLTFALQQEFQAGVKAQGPTANPSFVGNTLEISAPAQGLSAYSPNYRNARSYQFNFGIQRQIGKGVFTADYLRNVSTRFQLTIDVNHVGDARFLDPAAALNAINLTAGPAGCAAATDGPSAQAAVGCYIAATPGASINDFAGNGLDSGNAFGGGPAATNMCTTASGTLVPCPAAFGGINRNVGQGDFEFPEGRSVYNALQTSYKQQVANPFAGISSLDLTVAYTLSRFVGDGGNDQNFSATAFDNNNPGYFTGPTSLDRTHQFKFGATFDVAHHGPRFSVIGNFASAEPTTLLLLSPASPAQSSTGQIFRTDLTGDGTVQDPLPVSTGQSVGKPGQFMRTVNQNNLAQAIGNWNSTQAGTLTPAGQTLVASGYFTTAQLQTLGAVKPFVAPPPPGQIGNGLFREVSAVFAWPIKVTERFTIEPSVAAYNVLGFANIGRLSGFLPNQVTPYAPGDLSGNPNGSAVGTVSTHDGNSPFNNNSARIGTGSGVFSNGAPRQLEFGLRVNF
jgi:hypothetical protein